MDPGDKERGPRGYRGDPGDRGRKGEDARGPRGYQGEQGQRGERGLPGEGWDGYRRLVLQELNRLSQGIDDMDRQNRVDHAAVLAEVSMLKQEIGALKVKASFYGALAGLGAGIAVFIAQIFGRGLGH